MAGTNARVGVGPFLSSRTVNTPVAIASATHRRPAAFEAPAANRAAEHLALAAVAARRESIPAPKANAVFRHLENQEAADDDGRGCIVSLAPASLTASHNRYVGLLIP